MKAAISPTPNMRANGATVSANLKRRMLPWHYQIPA